MSHISYQYLQIIVHHRIPVTPPDHQAEEVLAIDKISGPNITLPKLLRLFNSRSGYTMPELAEVAGSQSSATNEISRKGASLVLFLVTL